MKKLVKVEEVEGEGLLALLGEEVLLLCANYFYAGKLTGVNSDCVLLENPSIVYDTGKWSDKHYANVQPVGQDTLYVQRSFIESFMKGKARK